MEDKDTSNLTHPKDKPLKIKIEPEYKPRKYTWTEFVALYKNGRNT